MQSYEIIDFHTHPFGHGGANICSHIANCDMSEENIIRDIQTVGISKICGSSIVRVSELGAGHTEWEAVEASNRAALAIADDLGGFYVPGIMVHPDYADESIAAIDYYYERGVRLIGELVPYMQGWQDYSCEGFSKIIDHATEKNMILSLHSMGEDEMDRMVERHPDTKFVFAHPGEYGAFCRHMKRLKMSKNAYLDLSGYGIFRHGMLRHAIDEVGVDRIIFGSDYPTCNPCMYVGGVMLDPMLTVYEKQAIFAGNIRKLFASVGLHI